MVKEKSIREVQKKTYRNIMDHTINVNAKPRDPYIPFEEEETQELINLTKHKYLEEIKKVEEAAEK